MMTHLILFSALTLIFFGSLIINYKKKILWLGILMTVLGTALVPIWNQTVASERALYSSKKERLVELITIIEFDLKPNKNDFYRPLNLIPIYEKNLNKDTTIYTKLMLDKIREERNSFQKRYRTTFGKLSFLSKVINEEKIIIETDSLYKAYNKFYIEVFNNQNNSKIKFEAFKTFNEKYERVLGNLNDQFDNF